MHAQNDDASKNNVNTGGGAYVGGNVSVNNGDFVGGNKIIYHSPPPPTAVDFFEQGRNLLKKRQYTPAIIALEKTIELDPDFAYANYYLAMALLEGNRPKLVSLKTVRSIEKHLKRTIELQPQDSGAYILWAFVKYDYYVLNGMYDRPPSHQDLLHKVSRINSTQAQEILTITNAEGNSVLQWLKLNS